MRVKFLGTGDSGGIPLWGCECSLCHRARSVASLRRRPTSAKITIGTTSLLIDAGRSDLCDLIAPSDIRGILLTHFHVDHVQGLFPLRWGTGATVPVWCPPDAQGCADLYQHPGLLSFTECEPLTRFQIGQTQPITITPIPLVHSKPCFGWHVQSAEKSLAWLSDTNGLSEDSLDYLQQQSIDLAVIDCTHPPSGDGQSPRNHNDLDSALNLIAEINPRRALLVHLSHHCARYLEEHEKALPRQVAVAYDHQTVAVS